MTETTDAATIARVDGELKRRLTAANERIPELERELDEARAERDDIRILLGIEPAPRPRGERRLGPRQMARRDYHRFMATPR